MMKCPPGGVSQHDARGYSTSHFSSEVNKTPFKHTPGVSQNLSIPDTTSAVTFDGDEEGLSSFGFSSKAA